jgi:hypothetical protein
MNLNVIVKYRTANAKLELEGDTYLHCESQLRQLPPRKSLCAGQQHFRQGVGCGALQVRPKIDGSGFVGGHPAARTQQPAQTHAHTHTHTHHDARGTRHGSSTLSVDIHEGNYNLKKT